MATGLLFCIRYWQHLQIPHAYTQFRRLVIDQQLYILLSHTKHKPPTQLPCSSTILDPMGSHANVTRLRKVKSVGFRDIIEHPPGAMNLTADNFDHEITEDVQRKVMQTSD